MEQNVDKKQQFINPYRQNKRCFNNYFRKPFLNFSQSSSINKNQHFLDNVSNAESLKVRQSLNYYEKNKQSQKKNSIQSSHCLIYNKRQMQELHNPELYNLVSKHIQHNQNKKIKNSRKIIISKDLLSKISENQRKQYQSQGKLQKTPKITQFLRQTFYHNLSTSKKQYFSKKQKEDNLHCKSDLQINTKKISLCKKTKLRNNKNQFVTYQVYLLKNRIGINAQILGGSLKQIKFRLILNQKDSKNFKKFWKDRSQQFIDKCLYVNEQGIELKVGAFNINSDQNKFFQNSYQIQKKNPNKSLTDVGKMLRKHYEKTYFSGRYSSNQKQKRANTPKAKQSTNEQSKKLMLRKVYLRNKQTLKKPCSTDKQTTKIIQVINIQEQKSDKTISNALDIKIQAIEHPEEQNKQSVAIDIDLHLDIQQKEEVIQKAQQQQKQPQQKQQQQHQQKQQPQQKLKLKQKSKSEKKEHQQEIVQESYKQIIEQSKQMIKNEENNVNELNNEAMKQ